jgi:hypothetical protein
MRTDELKTVSLAHKATVIHDQIKEGSLLHLNTDGTTLGQKKLGGIAMNKTVISVNEQCDGTAESVINDVSRELQKLRETACALGLPNSNCINWTLISSSTSDSAAMQKKFNSLIEQQKEKNIASFGTISPDSAIEIIENFCAMHLGCNLRKAFLVGIKSICDKNSDKEYNREYHQVDIIVHEFHKLFGKHGTPEYGCDLLMFPDYLKIKASDDTLSTTESAYYQACLNISLDRQVGNRYFVTAANAIKIMFLKDSAVSFLQYTFRHIKGNKLDKDLFMKLKDPTELVHLKMDALMFYHVYADLVELAKSKDLKKSVLDMNIHYFELQTFLKLLQEHPEVIMDFEYRVFKSEALLYGDNKKFNHRVRFTSSLIQRYLFKKEIWDETHLYLLLVAGAKSMESKLNSYAKTQLPGGVYWDPEPEVKEIHRKLEPSNDISESILGLNDYLSNAIPNMCQESRSNLVEVKKNGTIKWLETLSEEKQDKVVSLAMERRLVVAKERKDDNKKLDEKRRKHMIEEHNKQMALLQKAQEEREKLSQLHVITSSEELSQCIKEIENEKCSFSKKKTKQYALLREQINIRKKVLNQDIHIVCTQSRRKRSVEEIEKELSDFIEATTASMVHEVTHNGHALVGKRISHKFEIEVSQEKWCDGTIMKYDSETKMFEMEYDEEEE